MALSATAVSCARTGPGYPAVIGEVVEARFAPAGDRILLLGPRELCHGVITVGN